MRSKLCLGEPSQVLKPTESKRSKKMNRLAKLVCALAAMAATAGVGSTAHGAPILLKAKTIVPGQDQGKPRLMATTSTDCSTRVQTYREYPYA